MTATKETISSSTLTQEIPQVGRSELSASGEAATAAGTCCKGTKSCGTQDNGLEQMIRELAYSKWEQAGYPEGDGSNFWLEAEKELES